MAALLGSAAVEVELEEEIVTMKRKRKDGDDVDEGRESSSGSSEGEYEYEYEYECDDPMEVLGEDLVLKVFESLDACSLARASLVSRRWSSLATSDSLWSPLCEQLWLGKAHIPRCSQVPGLSRWSCYCRAVNDSKRDWITKEDLCDHAWSFHFTEAAPSYWKGLDPYWIGIGPSMRRYFHPDGSQTADQDDKVWGGHECSYTLVTTVVADGKIRENYVRVNRWPRLLLSRRDDWGWEMSNVICAYSSIPDACKEGGTGPIS